MKEVLKVRLQSQQKYTREFLEMKEPGELKVLLYGILSFFLISLGIVFFGKIDDVVKVNGIVRTRNNVSAVKNVIAGKIIEINYKPGQQVSKGDFLFKIDPTVYDSQRVSLMSERENLEERLSGNREMSESLEKGRNVVSAGNPTAFSTYRSYEDAKAKLEAQRDISLDLLHYEENLPEGLRNSQNIKQRKLAYEYDEKNLESYVSEFANSLDKEKDELELAYRKNAQEIQQLDSQYEFLKVYAPVSGYVQEVSSLNLGDFIESHANVLNIIPNDSENFRVEMAVSPKDIGKIRTGLRVKYRLSAFPFFEYRGAEGIITAVDPDIRTDSSGGMYYMVYADIDRVVFDNRRGESFPIRAGLETNSRIVLENSSILFFLLKKLDLMY